MVLGILLDFDVFLLLIKHRDKLLFKFLVFDGDWATVRGLLLDLPPVDQIKEVNVVDNARLLQAESSVDGRDVAHLQLGVRNI